LPDLPLLLRALEGAITLGLLLVSGNTKSVEKAPDYILVNGKMFTADTANPYAQALAIKGERLLSVGTSEEISRLASPHTMRIDLQGRVVIPGINDAHYHFLPRPVAHHYY
jgi:imidazolonepropionase-like amidohydrolase